VATSKNFVIPANAGMTKNNIKVLLAQNQLITQRYIWGG
jgi:hypothetical protein